MVIEDRVGSRMRGAIDPKETVLQSDEIRIEKSHYAYFDTLVFNSSYNTNKSRSFVRRAKCS